MDATLLLMVKALYPDHVKIKYVPSDWVRVVIPIWEEFKMMQKPPEGNPEAVPYKFEEVQLHEVCEGCDVWAGMSEATRILFVKVGGV
jgi:hypothetical protein